MKATPGPRAGAIAAVVASLTWSAGARAYRPFDGTDASVAPEGEIELEVQPLGALAEGPSRSLVVPWVVANLGIVPRCELVLEAKGLLALGADARRGGRLRLAEPSALFKAVLREGSLQGGRGLSVATELGPLLPAAGDDRGVGAQLAVLASHRWPALTIDVNVVSAYSRSHGYDAFVGAIFEGPGDWRVRPVGEVYALEKVAAGTLAHTLTLSALAGGVVRVVDALTLDFALRVARTEGLTAREGRLGFTWSFGAWRRAR
jgi:hypothetical protein